MSRRPYGNTAAAVVTDPTTGRPARRATFTAWFSETGDDIAVDLCDLDGRPLPGGVITADERGRLALLGPPGYDGPLWISNGGPRVALLPSDLHQRTDGAAANLGGLSERSDVTSTRLQHVVDARAVPSGVATLGPSGTLAQGQMPPLPPGVLDGLADVDVPAPMRGQALTYDGERWIPGRITPPSVSLGATDETVFINTTGSQFPQYSLAEAVWSAEAGFPLKVYVELTSDGALAVNRDRDLTDATTLTGSLDDMYRNALARRVVDAGAWFESGYPSLPIPTLEEVLDICAGRVQVIVGCVFEDQDDPELMSVPALSRETLAHVQSVAGRDDGVFSTRVFERAVQTVNKIAQVIRARGLADSVLVWPELEMRDHTLAEAPTRALLQTVLDADIQGVYGTVGIDGINPTLLTRMGLQWVSLYSWNSDGALEGMPERVRELNAAGLKVIMGYPPRTHAERDEALFSKPQAILTDQPLYMSSPARYRRKTDPFASQTRAPGMTPYWDPDATSKFLPPNWWNPGYGYYNLTTFIQGWGCPMDVSPSSWSMTFDVRYDVITAAGDADRRLFIVFCCPDDQSWTSWERGWGNGDKGYVAELRFNGGISIARFDADAPGADDHIRTSTVATPAPTAGQIINYRIDVTATSVRLSRQGSPGGAQVTMNDTRFRGLYFHIGVVSEDANTSASVRAVSYL